MSEPTAADQAAASIPTLDRLFLELSQFTTAVTAKEINLQKEAERLHTRIASLERYRDERNQAFALLDDASATIAKLREAMEPVVRFSSAYDGDQNHQLNTIVAQTASVFLERKHLSAIARVYRETSPDCALTTSETELDNQSLESQLAAAREEIERLCSLLAQSSNYVANKECRPTVMQFENGRTVRIIVDDEGAYLDTDFVPSNDIPQRPLTAEEAGALKILRDSNFIERLIAGEFGP